MNYLQSVLESNQRSKVKIVVIDDDPTGCQTVHGVPVLLRWDHRLIKEMLRQHDLLFILSNTRALDEKAAAQVTSEIVGILREVIPPARLRIISRSDSTLRGHFYPELRAILQYIPSDGIIVLPFFEEGGRITLDGIHYIREGNHLYPVAATEFANDPDFGFTSSYLPQWVEEKTKGNWPAKNTLSVSLAEIRDPDRTQVLSRLLSCSGGIPVIPDCENYSDLESFCMALCEAEEQGKRFIYRTGASFVRVRAGMSPKPLLTPEKSAGPGLIIVGSYIGKSGTQLEYLLNHADLEAITIEIAPVFSDQRETYLSMLIRQVNRLLSGTRTVVLYTERVYRFSEDTPVDRIRKAALISGFICELVQGINVPPAFLIAKGGITSLEIARKGLEVVKAVVKGQIAAGIPMWELDETCKFPYLPYVVFPGNVGQDKTLHEVYSKFT